MDSGDEAIRTIARVTHYSIPLRVQICTNDMESS